jgi:hypothetical protein
MSLNRPCGRIHALVGCCFLLFVFFWSQPLAAEQRPETNEANLAQLSDYFRAKLDAGRGPRYIELLQSLSPPQSADGPSTIP